MKHTLARMLLAFSSAAAGPVMPHPGHAHGHALPGGLPGEATTPTPDGIVVEGCWIRALPNRLPAAGYFVITNSSQHPVALVGAQAAGFGRVMLHTHQTVNGMSKMVHVDRVDVPAGERFVFAPGGHHLMLEKPAGDLEPGKPLPVTLRFEGDRALTVDCDVRGAAVKK